MTRAHFMEFLNRNFPELAGRYQGLHKGAYAPKAYAHQVKAIVKLLEERHGLRPKTNN